MKKENGFIIIAEPQYSTKIILPLMMVVEQNIVSIFFAYTPLQLINNFCYISSK